MTSLQELSSLEIKKFFRLSIFLVNIALKFFEAELQYKHINHHIFFILTGLLYH